PMARRPWCAMALPAPSGPGVRPAAAPLPFLLLAGAGAAFFILPLIGLLLRTPWNLAWDQLRSAEVLTALRLSLLASLSATAIALVFGVPLAWNFALVAFLCIAVLCAIPVHLAVLIPIHIEL